MRTQVMIQTHEPTKRYGDKTAVHTLSFTIAPGTVTVSGKPYGQHRSPLREVGALLDAKAVHAGRSAHSHLRTMTVTHNLKTSRVSEVIEMTRMAGRSWPPPSIWGCAE